MLIIGCSIGGTFLLILIVTIIVIQVNAFKRRKQAIERLKTHWKNLDRYI